MNKILIDTDVILDFFFNRLTFARDAAYILTLCENKKIQGYVTPVIMSNVYYLLRKTAGHKKVVEKLRQFVSIIEVLNINKAVITAALDSPFRDFEDALQNFACELKDDIDIIVTRNTKDYKFSSISVMTPESYLKFFKS